MQSKTKMWRILGVIALLLTFGLGAEAQRFDDWGDGPGGPGATPTPTPVPTPAPTGGIEDTMDEIYDDIVGADDDPFGYGGDTSDGCYARSALICDAIANSGKLPKGCYIDTVFVFWPEGDWWYHQACAVTCYTEKGVETFVFDGLKNPNGEAKTDDEWFKSWQCPGGTQERRIGNHMNPNDTTPGVLTDAERARAERVVRERKKK